MKNAFATINTSSTIHAVIERAYMVNTNAADNDKLKAIKVLNVLKIKRSDKAIMRIKAEYNAAITQMQAIYNSL